MGQECVVVGTAAAERTRLRPDRGSDAQPRLRSSKRGFEAARHARVRPGERGKLISPP